MKSTPGSDAPPSRAYRGESAEARRQQRHEKLLEGAFEAFAALGIARTTMRDICAQARLTDRYFYESFRNTEDAFDAVHRWQRELLLQRVAQAMKDSPRGVESIARAGLHAFYSFIKEDPRRAQVLLIDAFSANRQSAEKVQRSLEQYATLIAGIARSLYPRLKRGFNLEMLMWGLLGMAIQVGTVWARNGFKEPVDEVLEYNLYAWQGLETWVNRMARDAMDAAQARRQREGVRPAAQDDEEAIGEG
ncbi:MAG: TetR/AcrR family transcriptional regulator [Pseudomonadota bacterium]